MFIIDFIGLMMNDDRKKGRKNIKHVKIWANLTQFIEIQSIFKDIAIEKAFLFGKDNFDTFNSHEMKINFFFLFWNSELLFRWTFIIREFDINEINQNSLYSTNNSQTIDAKANVTISNQFSIFSLLWLLYFPIL